MAQDTSTAGGAAEVLTIEYEPGVRNTINQMSPYFKLFQREGSNKLTRSKNTQFAIKTRQGNTVRGYGQSDPDQFDTNSLENAPGYDTSTVNYRKMYAPYRVKLETMQEATAAGAHFDVLEQDLNDLAESFCHYVEWQFNSSSGFGAIARVNRADPDSDQILPVDQYGGLAGQSLGVLLENLNLEGQWVEFATSGVTAPTAARARIDSVQIDDDTITFEAGNPVDANVADNDYIYLSNSALTRTGFTLADSNDTPEIIGLPGLIDDFGRLSTFQGLTDALASRFKSHVLENAGVNRPLTEALLQRAISIGRVRQPGKSGDGPTMARWKFMCHDFQRDDFALQLTADRRYTSPLLGKQGIKAYAGWDMGEVLCFDGIPFVCSQLALRNSLFMVDCAQTYICHNGPAEGQFLVEPGGSGRAIRDPGTPIFEYVWWSYMNFAMRQRNSSVRIDDLTTITGI